MFVSHIWLFLRSNRYGATKVDASSELTCELRLSECLRLRVQDINLDTGILTVHDGKGKKDRTVPLPETMIFRACPKDQIARLSYISE